MSITRRETRTWGGGAFNPYGPYADGRIPPPTWQPGSSTAGVPVNPDTALRIGTVWACVQLVSEYIAGLPVSLVKPSPTGEIESVGVPPLLAQPWPEWTQYEWFFAMQASLMLRGNAYGRKMDPDSLGFPRMIEPVSPDHVDVRRENGRLVYRFDREIIPNNEVFHLRAFILPGHVKGLSPVEYFANTMGVNLAAVDFGARFFGDGAHPTAVLESDQRIDEIQAKTILARIRDKFAGGNREPVVMGAGLKWHQVQVNPNESQFLDTINASDLQIARIFGLGVAPGLVGVSVSGQNITYATVESRDLDLQTYGVMPWTERWTQALSPLFPVQRSKVAFDLDARLKVDMKSRYEALSIAMRSGAICADDWRSVDGRGPVPDGAGQRFNWPPYNVKNEPDAAQLADDPALLPT